MTKIKSEDYEIWSEKSEEKAFQEEIKTLKIKNSKKKLNESRELRRERRKFRGQTAD